MPKNILADPNPNTFLKYYKQIETYEKFLGNKDIKIHAGQTTKDSPSFIGVDGKRKLESIDVVQKICLG